MAANKVTRLQSQHLNDIAAACRVLLDRDKSVGFNDKVRDALAEAYERFASPDLEPWSFVMLNPDQLRTVLKYINATEKPATTLRVWYAVLSRIQRDTGEIMASGEQLAEDTDTSPQEVSRGLTQLVKIGALTRIRRGRYAINPYVGWAGLRDNRQAAALASNPVKLKAVSE